jgi:SHS family lactate transporter-like MFS transporter
MTTDPLWIIGGFILQAFFAGGKDSQNPSYLSERFPTEVRATAAGFVYHQGATWGGFIAPVIAWFAVDQGTGFAIPMLVGTAGCLAVLVFAVFLGPETYGSHPSAERRASSQPCRMWSIWIRP